MFSLLSILSSRNLVSNQPPSSPIARCSCFFINYLLIPSIEFTHLPENSRYRFGRIPKHMGRWDRKNGQWFSSSVTTGLFCRGVGWRSVTAGGNSISFECEEVCVIGLMLHLPDWHDTVLKHVLWKSASSGWATLTVIFRAQISPWLQLSVKYCLGKSLLSSLACFGLVQPRL